LLSELVAISRKVIRSPLAKVEFNSLCCYHLALFFGRTIPGAQHFEVALIALEGIRDAA